MGGGVDTGGYLGQEIIPIGPDTNIQTLSLLAEDAAADLLEDYFEDLAADRPLALIPQADEFAFRCAGRRPEDGPSRKHADRCGHVLEHPPAPDSDGLWVMKDK